MKRNFVLSSLLLTLFACGQGADLPGSQSADSPDKISSSKSALTNPVYTGVAVELRNRLTGLCMDVPNSSIFSGQTVWTYTCNGGPNQRWFLRHPQSCLGGNLWDYWLIPGCSNVYIENMNSGLCLDIPNGSTNPDVPIQQYPCHYGNSQLFSFGGRSAADGGGVFIDTVISGENLSLQAVSDHSVKQESYGGYNFLAQVWDIVE
jgi:hypothetical protein